MSGQHAPERLALEAAVLDQAGDAIITTDLEGVILTWNRAAEELYGWSRDEALGQQIYYLLPAALSDTDIDRMMGDFREGLGWSGELVIRRKDGEWATTFHTDRPLVVDRKVTGVISVSHDLGHRRAVDEASRRQVVTKELVRTMLQSLGRAGAPTSGVAMRELGRALARKANCQDMSVFVTAFATMGLGDLRAEPAQEGRYVFAGENLLEARAGAKQPTCQLPLGYLEGAVEAITGVPALGAETRCQSMGAHLCMFVVAPRRPSQPYK